MKKNILTALLFVVAILVSMTSCSQIMEELGDEFGDVGGGFGFTSDRSMVRNAKEEHPMEMAEMREDAKTDRVVAIDEVEPTEPVEFEEESRYIYSLDGMSDYEIIEYVMPALELAEECDLSMATFGLECYDTAYYLLFEEKTLATTPLDVVELTETYVPENTYGMNVYNIDGEYLGDRRLIGDGGTRTAYRAWNVNNFEELEDYLSNYFSEYYLVDVMRYADNTLMYFDGSLYVIRGNCGYGYINLSYSGAQVISRRDNSCKIKVPDYTDRGDEAYNYSYIYEFVIENDRLVLDSVMESKEFAGTQYSDTETSEQSSSSVYYPEYRYYPEVEAEAEAVEEAAV